MNFASGESFGVINKNGFILSKKRMREIRGKKDKDIERERERQRERKFTNRQGAKKVLRYRRLTCEQSIARGKGNSKHKVGCILCPYKIKHSSSKTCFFVLSDYESHQLCFETSIAHMPKFDLQQHFQDWRSSKTQIICLSKIQGTN